MAAGRRRQVEHEFAGRVKFERRTYLLMPQEGSRPAYDDYVIGHRVRAAAQLPELKFAIPKVGMKYPLSSWPAQLVAMAAAREHPDKLPLLEDALFGAMFRELRDVADSGVLRECARAAGIPESLVADSLADPVLREQAEREHMEGEDLGLQGIPALVLPGLPPITGAVPVDFYRRALDHVLGAAR